MCEVVAAADEVVAIPPVASLLAVSQRFRSVSLHRQQNRCIVVVPSR